MKQKKIIAFILIFTMIVGIFNPLNIQDVYAYSKDYNYIDNLLKEVGYDIYYDDSLNHIAKNCVLVGDFNASSYSPCRYWYYTNNRLFNNKTVISPMTKQEFVEARYNLDWAIYYYNIDRTNKTQAAIDSEASSKLVEYWENYNKNVKYDISLTANSNFKYCANYGEGFRNAIGKDMVIVCINNSDITEINLTVDSEKNISDYCFAFCKSLKSLALNYENSSKIYFPKAFAYSCTSLKYLTYPQNKQYIYDEYAFAKCTSLIHWTGLGRDGAIKNFLNATDSSYYEFGEYSFSGCTAITHADFTADTVILKEYAFGKSGLIYIGMYDYIYSPTKQNELLGKYINNAHKIMLNNRISDKAFDGVSANRIYVAHKDIYNAFLRYCDGKICGRTLCVANISIHFDAKDSTSGYMLDTNIRYDDDIYTLLNKYEKIGNEFVGWSNENGVLLLDKYNAPHAGTDWITAFNGSGTSCYLGETTLYPTWKEVVTTFDISYVLNGGIPSGELPQKYTYGKVTYLLNPPIKDKYRFMGWYLDSDFKTRVYDISATTHGNITLYAKFEPTVAILKIPTKDGHRFIGWVTKKNKKIKETDLLSAHKGDIYASFLDIRWTKAKKYSAIYTKTLRKCHEWYLKADKDSLYEKSADGTLRVFGVHNGMVATEPFNINVEGKVTSVTLIRNGKKVKLDDSYFVKTANGEYFKGYHTVQSGVYTLVVKNKTGIVKVKFMKDNIKPVVTAIVKTKHKIKKNGKYKTITKTKKFKVTQTRRFYKSATVTWADSLAGVSTVYVNKKQLSDKEVKKRRYTFKKNGEYLLEIYDHLGNKFSQKIVVSNNKDVTLPSINLKDGKSYYVGATLIAKDKSGIKDIVVKDSHGFKYHVKNKYTFKWAGEYEITVYDKVGNYRKVKVKFVNKKLY